jgi:hypothetical protein
MPAVCAAEVAALKAEGQAQSLDGADATLETVAEQLAFLIYESRHFGADQAEVLHDVELLCRAVPFDRSELREARDVLRALNYPPAISKLLTRLARRAPPRPLPAFRGVGHRCRSDEWHEDRRREKREWAEAAAAAAEKATEGPRWLLS